MRRIIAALALLTTVTLPAEAATVCVLLSPDGSAITSIVRCVNTAQQPQGPLYAALSSTDNRVVTFQNAQQNAANAATVAASQKAALLNQANKLLKQGDTSGALKLYLQAQGIQ
jgi:ABC-type histidine transport system ATPase subunit